MFAKLFSCCYVREVNRTLVVLDLNIIINNAAVYNDSLLNELKKVGCKKVIILTDLPLIKIMASKESLLNLEVISSTLQQQWDLQVIEWVVPGDFSCGEAGSVYNRYLKPSLLQKTPEELPEIVKARNAYAEAYQSATSVEKNIYFLLASKIVEKYANTKILHFSSDYHQIINMQEVCQAYSRVCCAHHVSFDERDGYVTLVQQIMMQGRAKQTDTTPLLK